MAQRPLADTQPPPADALFRYRLVSEVLACVARGQRRGAAVATVAARPHPDGSGGLRRVSQRSLYRWLARYRDHGFAGLAPAPRPARATALPQALLDFLAEQKRCDPDASLPELIRRAREHGIVGPEQPLQRSTVYRAIRRLGLPVARRRRRASERDSRRFAYPHRMQMLLCDGKHFRAGAARARRVALVFLDDATRLALHAVVGTSESAALFLRGLYETTCRYGRADIYYLDRGPGFVAADSAEVVCRLGGLLIHGEAAYPQGHGKVERFNQSLKADLLRGLDGRPDIDPRPAALELRLQHYLRETYNQRPHHSLEGDSPAGRFQSDTRALALPDSDAVLRRCFVLCQQRRVSADHVVSLEGVAYEVPRGHAGRRVTLHRFLLDERLAMLHHGRLVALRPLDPAANARARRARAAPDDAQSRPAPPKSAAELAFERELGPLVDRTGGFRGPAED